MRTLAMAGLLLSLTSVLACGGDGRRGTTSHLPPLIGNHDMAGGGFVAFDFATSPGSTKVGCAGYTHCYLQCLNNGGDTTSCASSCGALARSNAPTLFDAALGCGQQWCLDKGTSGGTSYKCKVVSNALVNADGSQIADTDPGTGLKACGACLGDALAALLESPCANTSSIDCNPSLCASDTDACLSDTP